MFCKGCEKFPAKIHSISIMMVHQIKKVSKLLYIFLSMGVPNNYFFVLQLIYGILEWDGFYYILLFLSRFSQLLNF